MLVVSPRGWELPKKTNHYCSVREQQRRRLHVFARMETPNTLESVLFVWSVFAVFATLSMAFGTAKATHMAKRIDAELQNYSHKEAHANNKREYIRLRRAINITLVFYTLCLCYLTFLFLMMVTYGVVTLLHVLIDVTFHNPDRRPPSAQTLERIKQLNRWLNPGILFESLAIRHWGSHALVLTCILAIAGVHSYLFASFDYHTSSVESAYLTTARTALYTSFAGLYTIVFGRDLLRVSAATAFGFGSSSSSG